MITTVVFDVGGTLVDGPDVLIEISRKIRTIHGITVEEELRAEFQRVYSGPGFFDVKTILKMITQDILIRKGVRNAQIDTSNIYYDVYVNKSKLFPDSKDILEYLKNKNIRLIAVTDADSDVLIPELDRLGVLRFFHHIIVSSDIKCYKSSEEIVVHLNPQLGEHRVNALFVGDSVNDVRAAKRLGISSVYINRHSDEKQGDFTIRSLSELKLLV